MDLLQSGRSGEVWNHWGKSTRVSSREVLSATIMQCLKKRIDSKREIPHCTGCGTHGTVPILY